MRFAISLNNAYCLFPSPKIANRICDKTFSELSDLTNSFNHASIAIASSDGSPSPYVDSVNIMVLSPVDRKKSFRSSDSRLTASPQSRPNSSVPSSTSSFANDSAVPV